MVRPNPTGNIYIGATHVADLAYTGLAYTLTYRSEYLQSPNPQPIAAQFPLQQRAFQSPVLFPYFENLAPEGLMAETAAAYYQIDNSDKFSVLLGLGRDLSGHLRIECKAFPSPPHLDLPAAPLETTYLTQRCLASYEPVTAGHYSPAVCEAYGLQPDEYLPIRQSQLTDLLKASAQASVSLAGFQPKISGGVILCADLSQAAYLHSAIIKLPNPAFPRRHVLANEHLTTLIAKRFGITANDSVLMPMADGQLALVIMRFDRGPNAQRYRCEDFCQILGQMSESKYSVPTESLAQLLRTHTANPKADQTALFNQLLFVLYSGNSDAHLKNFSLLTVDGLTNLSPAYDLVATKLVTRDMDDVALSINNTKSNLGTTHIWHLADAFEQDTNYVISRAEELARRTPEFCDLIDRSHLSDAIKREYKELLHKNVRRYHLASLAQHAPVDHVKETHYPDGALESRAQMRGKKRHGLYESFYPDGRRKEAAHYQYGYRHGETRTWGPSGTPEPTQNYSYGLRTVGPQTLGQPSIMQSRARKR